MITSKEHVEKRVSCRSGRFASSERQVTDRSEPHLRSSPMRLAANPADSVAFAKQYGCVDRTSSSAGQRRPLHAPVRRTTQAAAKLFEDNGIKVSFLNAPDVQDYASGNEPVFRKPETREARETRIARHQAEFDRRKQDFQQAFPRRSPAWTDKIRVFTFLRTAEPEKLNQHIADVIGEMAEMAGKEKIRLLVENESACNVVSCAEVATFMKLLPEKTVGLNWDPLNGTSQKEIPYPDGYKLLPAKTCLECPDEGAQPLDPAKKLDWAGIFQALVASMAIRARSDSRHITSTARRSRNRMPACARSSESWSRR